MLQSCPALNHDPTIPMSATHADSLNISHYHSCPTFSLPPPHMGMMPSFQSSSTRNPHTLLLNGSSICYLPWYWDSWWFSPYDFSRHLHSSILTLRRTWPNLHWKWSRFACSFHWLFHYYSPHYRKFDLVFTNLLHVICGDQPLLPLSMAFYTRFSWIYLLERKSDAFTIFQQLKLI